MEPADCILIFDIGKTNKKVFVLDESYNVIYEQSAQLAETTDKDGFPCEDVNALTRWVQSAYKDAIAAFGEKIKTVNCSAYGASLVHVDVNLKPIAPLYNYLKPFPGQAAGKTIQRLWRRRCFFPGHIFAFIRKLKLRASAIQAKKGTTRFV